MRNILLFGFVFLTVFLSHSQDLKQKKTKKSKIIEQSAVFIGNGQSLEKYIVKNTVYPQEALEKDIEGKVIVSFIVERDGSVSNIQIVESSFDALEKEAVRLVESTSLKWSPGMSKGVAVRTKMYLPINFKLD